MPDSNFSTSSDSANSRHGSLSKTLILWFLLLALVPLSSMSWLGYQQARKNLTQAAQQKLEQSATAGVHFIDTWFNYRLNDLNNLAESEDNTALLTSLIEGLHDFDRPADEYVKKFDWVKRVDGVQNDLITLHRRYDYIYDIFLIDADGNILYTVEQQTDLGRNLFDPPLDRTRFAASVKTTLNSGQATFSGLEYYAPSKGTAAGFISAPLLDERGDIQGVFTIQLRFDKMFDLVNASSSSSTSLHHYLITTEGMLRTPVRGDDWDQVLHDKIDTEGFDLWQKDFIKPHHVLEDHYQAATEYLGPEGKQVIGAFHTINLANIEWLLISEIDSDEALVSAQWLGKTTFALTLLTAILVAIVAFFQARRISKPVIALADASKKVAEGELDQKVYIDSDNEIGQLAGAFNQMVQARRGYEQDLQATTQQAQQALAELEDQKFALDQHAIVTTTDVKGIITYANSRFCEISGYSVDEIIGEDHRILNSGDHDKNYWRDMYRVLVNGGVFHDEIRNKAKNGDYYWVDTTIVPFKDENGKPIKYISIRTDITERKMVDAKLLKAKEKAETANIAKSQFLATMSHEIRTPMNGVIGMTQLLQDTPLNDDQKDYLGTIVRSGNSLLSIINDILDFSKLDADMVSLELINFDLERVCQDCMELVAGNALDKTLEFVFDYHPDCPRYFIGDPSRIRQVLMNLLGNAVKFTHQGHIRLAVNYNHDGGDEGKLAIEVEDTGIGLKAESIAGLFDEFTQADQATTRQYGGTGLGLAITKKLIGLMGCEIVVDSVLGEGSCFTITGKLALAEAPQSPTLDSIDDLRVLFVDDNQNNRFIFKRMLEHMGTRPSIVDRPEQVIDCLQAAIEAEDPFQIAILDHSMPGISGLELGTAIRGQTELADLKLLIFSSIGQKGDAAVYKQAGFNAYLNKLSRYEILRTMLSAMLRHQTGQALITQHSIEDAWASTQTSRASFDAHILLVDDVLPNQMIAKKFLERLGATVDVADDGQQAVDCYQQNQYDLIFMDCRMPVMDGYQASSTIRDLEKQATGSNQLPIIALTANASTEDKILCEQAGMNDVITKPFKRDDLANCLQQWLPTSEVARAS